MNKELFDFIQYNKVLYKEVNDNQKAIIDDIFDGEGFNKSLYIKNYDDIVKKAVILYNKEISDYDSIEYDYNVTLYLYDNFIEKFKNNPMKYKDLFPYWYEEGEYPSVDYIVKNYITGETMTLTSILNKIVTEGKTTYNKNKIKNSKSRIIISAKKPVLLKKYFNMLYEKGLKFKNFKDLEKHLTKVKAKIIKAEDKYTDTQHSYYLLSINKEIKKRIEDKKIIVDEMKNTLEWLIDNDIKNKNQIKQDYIESLMDELKNNFTYSFKSEKKVLEKAEEFTNNDWNIIINDYGWTPDFIASLSSKKNKLQKIKDLDYPTMFGDIKEFEKTEKDLDNIIEGKYYKTKVKAKVNASNDKFKFLMKMEKDLTFLIDNHINNISHLESFYITEFMEDYNNENMEQWHNKEELLKDAKELANGQWNEFKNDHGWSNDFLNSSDLKKTKLNEITKFFYSNLGQTADSPEAEKAMDIILAKKDDDKLQEIYNLLYSDDIEDVKDLDKKLKKILESKIMTLSLDELDKLEEKLDTFNAPYEKRYPMEKSLYNDKILDEYSIDFLFDEMANDLATDDFLTEEDIVEYSEMTTDLIKRNQKIKTHDKEMDLFEDQNDSKMLDFTKSGENKIFTEDEVRKRARLSSKRKPSKRKKPFKK